MARFSHVVVNRFDIPGHRLASWLVMTKELRTQSLLLT
jgi:hypothetical protein